MPATPRVRAVPALSIALLGLALVPPAVAAAAEVALSQATESAGQPLARPTVGEGSAPGAALPFHLALTHSCPTGSAASQLFVSIADTARLVDAGPPGTPQLVTLDVPLRQLLWLAQPAAACRTVGAQRQPDETGTEGLRYFRLHAGTAGYATVTCRDGEGNASWATTSAPLDVWLSCPAASAQAG
jgi:hypothetical protein